MRNVKDFLDIVQRSGLIQQRDLIAALSDCKQNGQLPSNAKAVADHLVQCGLLTAWQTNKLLAGKTKAYFLGKYKLLDHLGKGGMSSVFLAEHTLIGRRVAIKVLTPRRARDSSFLPRFVREAQATARLNHPNIVRAYDIDQQDGTHYMVMEFVAGRDLKATVLDQGPLPLKQAANYVAQAAMGLQHAHERGLVHRDIKPANLIVNENNIVKILDLGLARFSDDEDSGSLTLEHSENVMGTADYLAPEQARNCHDVDHRADIYGLGCTFYFLLTGHPPFTEGTLAQRMLKHQTENPRDVRADRDDCPHALAEVCMRMLAKDPADRFDKASDVAARLRNWLIAQGQDVPELSRASDLARWTEEAESCGQREGIASIPELATAPISDSPAVVSVTDTARRVRRAPAVKTPLGLWLFLAGAAIACVALLVYLFMRH